MRIAHRNAAHSRGVTGTAHTISLNESADRRWSLWDSIIGKPLAQVLRQRVARDFRAKQSPASLVKRRVGANALPLSTHLVYFSPPMDQ
jgi:hypothetical protein